MANLTLSIEAELLQSAREVAMRERTTVNAVVRDFLSRYVDARTRRLKALDALDERHPYTRQLIEAAFRARR